MYRGRSIFQDSYDAMIALDQEAGTRWGFGAVNNHLNFDDPDRGYITGGAGDDNDISANGDYLYTIEKVLGYFRERNFTDPIEITSNFNVKLHTELGNHFNGLTDTSEWVSITQMMPHLIYSWQIDDHLNDIMIFRSINPEVHFQLRTGVLTLE